MPHQNMGTLPASMQVASVKSDTITVLRCHGKTKLLWNRITEYQLSRVVILRLIVVPFLKSTLDINWLNIKGYWIGIRPRELRKADTNLLCLTCGRHVYKTNQWLPFATSTFWRIREFLWTWTFLGMRVECISQHVLHPHLIEMYAMLGHFEVQTHCFETIVYNISIVFQCIP